MANSDEHPNQTNSSHHHEPKVIQPDSHSNETNGGEKKEAKQSGIGPAVDLIRKKIDAIYSNEPDAETEIEEAEAAGPRRSKHQQFMHELHQSGKPLAEIQTAWHEYYQNLQEHEKHEVWQEFHAQADDAKQQVDEQKIKKKTTPLPTGTEKPNRVEKIKSKIPSAKALDPRSVAEIKGDIVNKVKARSKASPKSHFKSLLFGLSMGLLSIMVMLFGLFNERIIAPFITPSKSVSSTPIISDLDGKASGNTPRIIIPKINVDIPVVYDQESIVEDDFQKSLEDGVVHYATTAKPGEKGNAAIFGHSSNNILNPGKYKFAFVLLNRLQSGDTFILEKDGKRYVYKVYEKQVVKPTNLSVLDDKQNKTATVSLITCDPPGTVQNRLVVVGEQISPEPNLNLASSAKPVAEAETDPEVLPSNAPSLWHRLFGWLGG